MANENLSTIKAKIAAADGITLTGPNSTDLANLKSALTTALGNEANAIIVRDQAIAIRDAAIAERDAAIVARDNAVNACTNKYYLEALTAKDVEIAALNTRIANMSGTVMTAEHASLVEYQNYDIRTATVTMDAEVSYTGSAITPTPTIKIGNTTLTKDTHYTLSYANNTAAGTATVTITGKGSYFYTKSATFTIVAAAYDISKATIAAISAQAYTGSAIQPDPVVTLNGTTLTKGTEYSVGYANNTEAGTATVTVTGKGSYKLSKSTTFVIVDDAHNITKATIAAVADQTATGSAITPTPAVTIGDTTLVKDTDYELSYANNTAAGTATITVTGKGSYYFTKTSTFTITAAADE